MVMYRSLGMTSVLLLITLALPAKPQDTDKNRTTPQKQPNKERWPEEITQDSPLQFYDCLYNYYYCTDHIGTWPENQDICYNGYKTCETAVKKKEIIKGTIRDLALENSLDNQEIINFSILENSTSKDDVERPNNEVEENNESNVETTTNGEIDDFASFEEINGPANIQTPLTNTEVFPLDEQRDPLTITTTLGTDTSITTTALTTTAVPTTTIIFTTSISTLTTISTPSIPTTTTYISTAPSVSTTSTTTTVSTTSTTTTVSTTFTTTTVSTTFTTTTVSTTSTTTTVSTTPIPATTAISNTPIPTMTTISMTPIPTTTTISATPISTTTTISANPISTTTTISATPISSTTTISATPISTTITISTTSISDTTTIATTTAIITTNAKTTTTSIKSTLTTTLISAEPTTITTNAPTTFTDLPITTIITSTPTMIKKTTQSATSTNTERDPISTTTKEKVTSISTTILPETETPSTKSPSSTTDTTASTETSNEQTDPNDISSFVPLTGPGSCSTIKEQNETSQSGIYTLILDGKAKQVMCEMKKDDGWTILQRRGEYENEENYFYRNWDEYRDGFGDLNGEHWIGLEAMFELTNQEKKVDLRFILEDYEGNRTAVTLVEFRVANEESGYRLFYKGIINHSRSKYPQLGRSVPAKGTKFSTLDRDNDEWKGNCAVRFSGGWWYSACHNSNINGLNLRGTHKSFGNGINWYHFRGYHYSLKATEMKIKPNVPRGK